MTSFVPPEPDRHRAELIRLDTAADAAWRCIDRPAAVDLLRRLNERRARVLGLDPPAEGVSLDEPRPAQA